MFLILICWHFTSQGEVQRTACFIMWGNLAAKCIAVPRPGMAVCLQLRPPPELRKDDQMLEGSWIWYLNFRWLRFGEMNYTFMVSFGVPSRIFNNNTMVIQRKIKIIITLHSDHLPIVKLANWHCCVWANTSESSNPCTGMARAVHLHVKGLTIHLFSLHMQLIHIFKPPTGKGLHKGPPQVPDLSKAKGVCCSQTLPFRHRGCAKLYSFVM